MLPKAPRRLSTPSPKATGRRSIGCWLNLLFIPALIVIALLLPPISILDRFSDPGYSNVGKSGADFNDPDGALLSITSHGMETANNTRVKFESLPRDAFLNKKAGDEMAKALTAFPATLDLKSPVYLITLKGDMPGDAIFSAPIPNDSEPYNTLDFYAWDGTKWDFVPGKFYEDDTSEASLTALPRAIVIAQTHATPPVVAAQLPAAGSVPAAGASAIAEVNPLGLSVKVPLPRQVSDDDYDTGAYDWQAIGAAADSLKIPSLTTANAYNADGAMDHLLHWAVERVNRYRLQFVLDTLVQDRVNNQTTSRTY